MDSKDKKASHVQSIRKQNLLGLLNSYPRSKKTVGQNS